MLRLKKKFPLFVSIIFLGIMFTSYFVGIKINITPSMKPGLYVRTYGQIHRGDLVFFCLKEPYKTLGLKNLYLEPGRICGGHIPLIKQVIAVPGDDIVLTNQYMVINEVKYPYKTQSIDCLRQEIICLSPRALCSHAGLLGYWYQC